MEKATTTTTAVAVLDAAVLLVLRRAPSAALRHLTPSAPWSGSDPAALDAGGGVDRIAASLAAAALWLVAAWVALALVAVIGARLPGLAGRICGTASEALLPRIVRTALAGSAGLGVLCAAGTAGAVPSPGAESSPQASATVGAPRSPAHLQTADRDPRTQPVPAPAWPLTAQAPVPPPTWPATGVADTHRVDDPAGTTTVRPGDSLWLIAARRLGAHRDTAHIAAAWPRWYAANRDVIGDDPNYIVAGQVLHPPAPATRQESPS